MWVDHSRYGQLVNQEIEKALRRDLRSKGVWQTEKKMVVGEVAQNGQL